MISEVEYRFLPCMEVIVSGHDTHDLFQRQVSIDIKTPYMRHMPRPPFLCWRSLVFALARVAAPDFMIVKSGKVQ